MNTETKTICKKWESQEIKTQRKTNIGDLPFSKER